MGACTWFETHSVGSAIPFDIPPVGILIIVISTLAILYIGSFLFLRIIAEEHFRLYLLFALLSAFTFFLAVVQRLLPSPQAGAPSAYVLGRQVLLAFLIAMQWLVHTGAVFFLLVRNPGADNLRRRVLLPACAMMLLLLFPWILTQVLGKPFVGEVIDEGVLVVFFSGALLLCVQSFRDLIHLPDFRLHPRPMMPVWASFMLLTHLCFFITYLVRGLYPQSEVGSCLYISVDSLYYALFAPIEMFLIQRDSRYWSEKGSILVDMHDALEASHQPEHIAGIPLIPFAELEFREKIGS